MTVINLLKYKESKETRIAPISSARIEAANDFGERLTRIRNSLDKLNNLMTELKAMSKK